MIEKATLEVRAQPQDGCILARPVGVLDASTYRQLRDALVKLAVEEPAAVVVDLAGLRIDSEIALTVFGSAWLRVSEWPGVPILLVPGDPDQQALSNGVISRYVPNYPTVAQAVAAAGRPPRRRRTNLDLDGTATSARMARSFVRETCADWKVPGLVADAMLVATELVENVALHAGTRALLRLELHRRMLTVGVRDGSPRPAVIHERVGNDRTGNGLRIIADLAHAWGCSPHLDGGKIVWAVLVNSSARRARLPGLPAPRRPR